MTDETFTEPAEPDDDWVDVRMNDPGTSGWKVDMVVDEGHVEYVDLRVRPRLLADFLTRLAGDVDDEHAEEVLATVADRRGLDPGDVNRGEPADSTGDDGGANGEGGAGAGS
jgi:hypothetical protein